MKRNIAIAAVTAAVLVGGGAVATAAFADDDDRGGTGAGTKSGSGNGSVRGSTGDKAGTGTVISVDEATATALRAVPGTVTGVELDDEDDDDRLVWELDVYGSDKVWHDVTVDAFAAKVLSDREDDDNDDRDRQAPRSAAVPLNAAIDAALAERPGTVTSVELDRSDDDDRRSGALRWDVDIDGKDGRGYELGVDARNGKVTVDQDDDSDDRDDRDDRSDDHDG
ncbi:PepSY domain-containing protein [Streptomyces sp. NPDC048560]|uniref:PepSY domain-containing protein n=1 Tax=Streptomyces sp. NPDC048560 TaxID=3155488 RepID=UPI0034490DDA